MLDTISASRAVRSKVVGGQRDDNMSNRSLTRASQSNDNEIFDDNGIRRTVDYRVDYD